MSEIYPNNILNCMNACPNLFDEVDDKWFEMLVFNVVSINVTICI